VRLAKKIDRCFFWSRSDDDWLLWRIYLLTAMDTVHKLRVYDAMAFNVAK
jgi:hypothetical protein